MALWNNVKEGFNPADETFVFGPRTCIENDGVIYEATTQAVISTDCKVVGEPRVLASTSALGNLCVAIDRNLIIFTNDQVLSCHVNIQLSGIVDCFTTTSDGRFLFICVRNEGLYCFNVETKKIVFKKKLKGLHEDYELSFVHITFAQTDESHEIFIIGNHGEIFRLQFTNSDIISQELNDVTETEENYSKFGKDYLFFDEEKYDGVSSAAVVYDNDNSPLVFIGGNCIKTWKSGNFVNSFPLYNSVSKLLPLKKSSYLLGLTTTKKLIAICTYSLRSILLHEHIIVEDFVILESIGGSETSILISEKVLREGKMESAIHFATFPGFDIKYSIKVPGVSSLVTLSLGAQEIFYLEGFSSANDCNIDIMRVKILAQEIPEIRLGHLLRRGLFSEAEKFADVYNLDLEMVHKGHAMHLANLEKNDINELLSVLDSIKDVQFVVECCFKTDAQSLSQIRSLLEYSCKRLRNNDKTSPDLETLVAHTSSMLLRLDTFEILYQSEMESVEEWLIFGKMDLFEKLTVYLNKGDMVRATLIWNRHINSFKTRLSQSEVSNLLHSIPLNVETEKLFLFLRFFIPRIFLMCQHVLEGILEWAFNKVRYFELAKSQWPENALIYLEALCNLIQRSSLSSDVLQHRLINSMLLPLIDSLRDVQMLRKKYHIHVTLNEFIQEDKEKAVACILNKTALKNLQPLLDSFLKPYLQKNNMNADHVLSQYLRRVINASSNYYQDSPWENTVSVLSEYIENIEDRIQCIHSALKQASVPWGSAMCKMADSVLQLDHPLSSEIKHLQKNATVKLILKKYGVTKWINSGKFNVSDSLPHIHKIIKQDRETMYDDIMVFCDVFTEYRPNICELLVKHYLERGEHTKAFSIVDSLDISFLEHLCSRITQRIEYLISFGLMGDIICNYIAAIDFIKYRYGKKSSELQDLPSQELKNIQLIKCEFGKTITLNDYMLTKTREDFLKAYISSIAEKHTEGINFSVKNKLERLAYLLQLSPESGPILMAQHKCAECDLDAACYYTRLISFSYFHLLEYKKLLETADLLIRSMADISPKEDSKDVVQNLSSSSCCYCPPDEIMEWLDIFQWSTLSKKSNESTIFTASVTDDVFNSWILSPLYEDNFLCDQNSVLFTLIREIYIIFKRNTNLVTEGSTLGIFQKYQKQMEEDSLELTYLKLLLSVYYKNLLNSVENKSSVLKSVNPLIEKLFQKIVASKKLDLTLGLAILFVNLETSLPMLHEAKKMYFHDCFRLGSVSEIAVTFCSLVGDVSWKEMFSRSLLGSKWVKQLVKFGIPYKEAYKISEEGELKMFKMLTVAKAPMELIEKFCQDFDLELDDYLLLYLESLLLLWKPLIEIVEESNGKKVLILKNSEDQLLKKAKEIMKKLVNHERISSHLLKIYNRINYYHYEVYICVAFLLEYCNPEMDPSDQIELLMFLKTYQRLGPPSQQEVDEWIDRFPEEYALPAIAEWRLPFLPLKENSVKIIMPELNLSTYKLWLAVSKSLKVDKETVCSLAATNSIKSQFSSKFGHKNSWSLTEHRTSFLKEIWECVAHCGDLEKACAVLYFATNNMPPGADQVLAAKMCYTLAVKWGSETSLSNRAENLIHKVEQKYHQLVATHILHKCGLGKDPGLLNLVSKPFHLMLALFQHQAITESTLSSSQHCPDINRAAEELARTFNINSIKFRKELLKELLVSDIPIHAELECTVNENFHNLSVPLRNVDNENLLRICYIMQVDEDQQLASYLVSVVLDSDPDSDTIGVGKKLKALRCLLTSTTMKTVEKLMGMDENRIRGLLKNLMYVSKLETLGIRYSVHGFESCNKTDLLNRIWNKCSGIPLGLKLIAELCLEYNVFNCKWWNYILEKMVKFQMRFELDEFLPQLTEHSHLLGCSGLVMAWNYIIIDPFKKADFPVTPEQINMCVESLVKLQACPVVNSIEVEEIMEHCLRIQTLQLAASILPFLRHKQSHYKKVLTSGSNLLKLKENLNFLANQGILTVPEAIKILELI